jgi:hypothetical protein
MEEVHARLTAILRQLWEETELRARPFPLKDFRFEAQDSLVPFCGYAEKYYEAYATYDDGTITIYPVLRTRLESALAGAGGESSITKEQAYGLHVLAHEFLHLFVPPAKEHLLLEEAIIEYNSLYYLPCLVRLCGLEGLTWEHCRDFECHTRSSIIINLVLALAQAAGVRPIDLLVPLLDCPGTEWKDRILDQVFPTDDDGDIRSQISALIDGLGRHSHLFGRSNEEARKITEQVRLLLGAA